MIGIDKTYQDDTHWKLKTALEQALQIKILNDQVIRFLKESVEQDEK